MNGTVAIKSKRKAAADYEATIAQLLADMNRLEEQMDRTEAASERLKAESQQIKEESLVIKARSTERLSRLEKLVDSMARTE